jgi:hypothetical protein
VDIDTATGTVDVGGGALWADVDAVTGPHNMAVPAGLISHTGVGAYSIHHDRSCLPCFAVAWVHFRFPR